MADPNLTDLLLNGMTAYGPAVLGSALLLGGVGVPIPATLLVMAAGALARQGVIDWSLALVVGLLGVVLGDNINYAIGRSARGWAQRRFEGSGSEIWQKAQARFEGGGGLAIYSTRFLFTPLAVPTNLVAGGSGYDHRRFLTYDVAGEATWLLLYGGLGYAFGSQWQLISQFISDFSSLLAGVAVVGAGVYFLIWRQHRDKLPALDGGGRSRDEQRPASKVRGSTRLHGARPDALGRREGGGQKNNSVPAHWLGPLRMGRHLFPHFTFGKRCSTVYSVPVSR